MTRKTFQQRRFQIHNSSSIFIYILIDFGSAKKEHMLQVLWANRGRGGGKKRGPDFRVRNFSLIILAFVGETKRKWVTTGSSITMSLGYAEKLSYIEDVGQVGMTEHFDPPHVLEEKVVISFPLCNFVSGVLFWTSDLVFCLS